MWNSIPATSEFLEHGSQEAVPALDRSRSSGESSVGSFDTDYFSPIRSWRDTVYLEVHPPTGILEEDEAVATLGDEIGSPKRPPLQVP